MKYSLCTSAPSPLLLVLNAYGQLPLHYIFVLFRSAVWKLCFREGQWVKAVIFLGGIITSLHNYERNIDS